MKEQYAKVYSRPGTLYHVGWQFMVSKLNPPGSHYFTRDELIQAIMASGTTESKAKAAAGVLLSPSAVNADQTAAEPGQILSVLGRGDCRGNYSSQGHLYEVLTRPLESKNEAGKKVRTGTEYKVRLRAVELPVRKRDLALTKPYLDAVLAAMKSMDVTLPAWVTKNETPQETEAVDAAVEGDEIPATVGEPEAAFE